MAYQKLLPEGFTPKRGAHWISTTGPAISGYFAVEYWMNPEMGGFAEPWDSGIGRYDTELAAAMEAVAWADEQEMTCVLPANIWRRLKEEGLVQEIPA